MGLLLLVALLTGTLLWLLVPAHANAAEPLSPYVSASGEHLALSVDALGTNNPAGGPIKVEKADAGETVRAAYLFTATTGETNYFPAKGDVTLNDEVIEWEASHTISSDIGSYNAVANVTSIVKPIVDGAPAGLVSFTVAEGANTANYDGEILAVLLEDPAIKEARSVTLLYGAQNPLGDTFHVGLAEPINKSNSSFALNLSLGISFGYQPAGQYSMIEVNKKLMTSSAGGQDDCFEKYSPTPDWLACGNGTLITAGGIGDTTEDPLNPAATDLTCTNAASELAPRCDDELYSLLPFVESGESAITFNTDNPSDNDNIFFGALEVHGGAAVIGEGITLSPTSATNKVLESHTVTAAVQNEHGEPIEGVLVHFQVTSGPNEGKTGEATTDSSGKAQFTYTSSQTGTDHMVAYFTNAHEAKAESNEASETWEEASKTTTTVTTTTTTPTSTTGVLASKETAPAKGSAHVAGVRGCVAQTGYVASVRGSSIAYVTFALDGHTIKTLRTSSHGAFALRIHLGAGSKHHLSIHVVFTASSKTPSKTIHQTLAHCAVRTVSPRFTG